MSAVWKLKNLPSAFNLLSLVLKLNTDTTNVYCYYRDDALSLKSTSDSLLRCVNVKHSF